MMKSPGLACLVLISCLLVLLMGDAVAVRMVREGECPLHPKRGHCDSMTTGWACSADGIGCAAFVYGDCDAPPNFPHFASKRVCEKRCNHRRPSFG